MPEPIPRSSRTRPDRTSSATEDGAPRIVSAARRYARAVYGFASPSSSSDANASRRSAICGLSTCGEVLPAGKPAVAVTDRLRLLEARVRDPWVVRLLLDAGPVAQCGLVDDVRAAVAVLVDVIPGADSQDDARTVAGADDHVACLRGAVHEVPLP